MTQPNWKNRTLFHGDNLQVMRAMNSETVDLIATDPPFNKGKDFHATPDSLAKGASFQDRWSWEKDVHETWLDDISNDRPKLMTVIENSRNTYGDDMGAFLCFMAVRLIAMRRLLKPTGSIYLHCDPTASHYLKMIMDAIFGRKNFRNEIIWHYPSMSRTKTNFPKKHDIILRYTKSDSFIFNGDDVRVPYAQSTTNRAKYGGAGFTRTEGEANYLKHDGKIPDTVWSIPHIKGKEHVGYPTQKPLKLYERIVQASSGGGVGCFRPVLRVCNYSRSLRTITSEASMGWN